MTPREVIQKTFSFEQTDIVPYHIPVDFDMAGRLNDYYGSNDWLKMATPFIIGWHTGFGGETQPDGTYRDPFGAYLRPGNISHVEQPALAEPTLDGYQWPEVKNLDDWDALGEHTMSETQLFRMYGLGYGLFERSWNMRGFENILVDMLEYPSFVESLLDGILDIHIKAMDLIATKMQIDAYYGGDDMCDQRGPIMGAELWRRFFKPRMAAMIDHCHSLGLPYVHHACGNVAPLIDDLMEIGMDGLESLQPEAMDIYELRKRTEGKMVLIGGLGAQSILPFGTPDEVRAETNRLIKEMGRVGGYILGPSKPLMADVPTPNAVSFIETARQLD